MKYSMNYYPKQKHDFLDSYSQNPAIFETVLLEERKKTTTEVREKETDNYEFVVPWQLP